MNDHFTQDDFEAYREMRKMVERAAWLQGISEIIGFLILLGLVCLLVRWLGL